MLYWLTFQVLTSMHTAAADFCAVTPCGHARGYLRLIVLVVQAVSCLDKLISIRISPIWPTHTLVWNLSLLRHTFYRLFHSKRNPSCTHTHTNPFTHKIIKTSGSTEFLQPCPALRGRALLKIGTALISVVVSIDRHLSHPKHFPWPLFPPPTRPHSVCCCLMSYLVLPCQIRRC